MVQQVIQIKNGIVINANVSIIRIGDPKKYGWNPSKCTCENSRYLTNIVDDAVIVCDEIKNATDNLSTNVTSTVSMNYGVKT